MDTDTKEVKSTSRSMWTIVEDKLFESALSNIPEGIVGWWQKLADAVPGKTVDQVRVHYEALVHDLHAIESDLVSVSYPEEEENESVMSCDSQSKTSQISFGTTNGSKQGERERKKGTPWTMEEHRKFLEGLKIYGKGDWRSISRNCVITRTATQVASHAQKYFIRQDSPRKEKKRASIHDITTTDTTMVVEPPQMPPPPPNFYGEGGGRAPPQMGYQYQQNIGQHSVNSLEFMRDEGYGQMTNLSSCNQLYLDGNDKRVQSQFVIITSTYLSCVGCLEDAIGTSFYLCLDCYFMQKCDYTHNYLSRFLDNYSLLEAMKSLKLSELKSPATRCRPFETVLAQVKAPLGSNHTWIHIQPCSGSISATCCSGLI